MKFFSGIFFLLLGLALNAQSWEMTISAGGPNYPEDGRAIAVDEQGNIYVTGSYRDFGFFGPNFYGTNGAADLYLVKYSPNGHVIWLQRLGGSGADVGRGLHLDGQGNVLITGQAKFGPVSPPGGGNSSKPGGPGDEFSRHLRDALIGSYSINGSINWVKTGDGVTSTEGYDITSDPSGAVYATGIMEGNSWFDSDTARAIGDDDIFLVKYSAQGNAVWAKGFGGKNADGYPHLTSDAAGNLYLAGTFRDTAYFGTDTLFRESGREAFLAKLDTSGAITWIRGFRGPGDETVEGISIDNSGHLYLAGSFEQSIAFDTDTLHSRAGHDIYLSKFDLNGNRSWTRSWAGTGGDFAADLTCAGDSLLFMVGSYNDTLFPDNDTLISKGFSDGILMALDSSGSLRYYQPIATKNFELPFGVTADLGCNPYVTGFYQDSLFLGDDTLDSWGGDDIFIAKVGEPRELRLENLVGFPWCSGESVQADFMAKGCFDSTNVFYLELSDGSGNFAAPLRLDSVAGMYGGSFSALIPSGLPKSGQYRMRVTSSMPVLSSDDNGSGLWISTDSIYPVAILGDTLICPAGDSVSLDAGAHLSYLWSTGDTSRSIFVDTAGLYEVTVSDSGGCTQLGSLSVSVCVGLEEDLGAEFLVRPNPASDEVRLSRPDFMREAAMVSLVDLQGRVLRSQPWARGADPELVVNLRGLPSSLYLIEVKTATKSYRIKLVKK